MKALSRRGGRSPRLPLLKLALPTLVALSALSVGCASAPHRGKPNILLISVDTLRADHLSSYGYDEPTSPFIDSLAAEGVRFENAFATSSWTTPSVVSMLTSTYLSRHRIGGRFGRNPTAWTKIPEELPNLAVALQEDGYRTYGLVANTNLAAERGFDRGFDRYTCLGTADIEEVSSALAPFLEEIGRDDGPWFFWLHLLDPHGPYRARKPWIEEFESEYQRHRWLGGMPSELYARHSRSLRDEQWGVVHALYDSEIRATDDFLRRLFDTLPGAAEALTLFTSDHGEEFFEHGGVLHGRTLYDETIRVPLIVRLPDRRFAGEVVEPAVSLVDVLPTLLGAAGLDPGPEAAGIDLIGPDGPAVPAGRVVVAEQHKGRPERATIDGRWKLIVPAESSEAPELYDLHDDRAERVNVAERFSDQVARLSELLVAFERMQTPGDTPLEQTEITPEQLEALRALGYVASE